MPASYPFQARGVRMIDSKGNATCLADPNFVHAVVPQRESKIFLHEDGLVIIQAISTAS